MCIFNQFPGDKDDDGEGTTLGDPLELPYSYARIKISNGWTPIAQITNSLESSKTFENEQWRVVEIKSMISKATLFTWETDWLILKWAEF